MTASPPQAAKSTRGSSRLGAVRSVGERESTVEVRHIEDVVARIARIPAKSVSSSDREVLKTLERNLKLVIFGQDKAIEALSSSIKMARSGLGDRRFR